MQPLGTNQKGSSTNIRKLPLQDTVQ